ncbi:DUF2071 domain-containing protein [Winogradskyella sp. 3972H.M.0a.05]|uniref:YqjF family protein n=1 Tax=Winogradskyella sp. 3972H.M.0a.05 TaxID=2950277 RepID=UPI0033980EAB
MNFLKAKWKNLILINYVIDPKILLPYVPKHTTLDFYDNKCYISLVGFLFEDTKVLGIKFPKHINFEEVNLRFYVKHNEKRGVVFIKEIVPKPLITSIANGIYHEHYETHEMSHLNSEEMNTYGYQWKVNDKSQSFRVTTKESHIPIEENSEAEFIAEHYYGYTKHKDKTFEYEVKHPTWHQKQILDYNINVDFGETYGKTFEFLNHVKPSSIIFTEGSQVSVENKTTINAD